MPIFEKDLPDGPRGAESAERPSGREFRLTGLNAIQYFESISCLYTFACA
jgi:hypothetical protein